MVISPDTWLSSSPPACCHSASSDVCSCRSSHIFPLWPRAPLLKGAHSPAHLLVWGGFRESYDSVTLALSCVHARHSEKLETCFIHGHLFCPVSLLGRTKAERTFERHCNKKFPNRFVSTLSGPCITRNHLLRIFHGSWMHFPSLTRLLSMMTLSVCHVPLQELSICL